MLLRARRTPCPPVPGVEFKRAGNAAFCSVPYSPPSTRQRSRNSRYSNADAMPPVAWMLVRPRGRVGCFAAEGRSLAGALSRAQSLGTLLANPHCPCMADQIEFLGQQPASMREGARTLRQVARATSLVAERKQMLVLANELEEKAASQEAHGVQPGADA
jgi:hypothetical protein